MTKKTNNKRLAVDLIWNLELVVWNLFEISLRAVGSTSRRPVYPG
jgi:hypothetical protein